jgi:hypothetical protein
MNATAGSEEAVVGAGSWVLARDEVDWHCVLTILYPMNAGGGV